MDGYVHEGGFIVKKPLRGFRLKVYRLKDLTVDEI